MNGFRLKYLSILCLLLLVRCSQQTIYKDLSPLSSGFYDDPSWSPDGKSIIAQYSSAHSFDSQILQVSPDGKEWNELIPASYDLSVSSEPIWINDTTLVFTKIITGLDALTFTSELVVFDTVTQADGRHTIQDYILNLSLDSTHHRLAVTQEHLISLYNLQSGNLTTLIKEPVDRFDDGGAFSPSGETFAYVTVSNTNPGHVFSLITLDLNTNEQHILINQGKNGLGDLTWSADGQWIVARIVDMSYNSNLLLIRPDGSQQIPLTFTFAQPNNLSWAPSGNLLAFTSVGTPGGSSLYVIDMTQTLNNLPNP